MRILIAEDEVISRGVLEAALEAWGHEVVSTCDGDEAWAVFQREDAPALAILDVMMPGAGGIEVCQRIRNLPQSFSPYLILLTAKRQKEDIVRGLEAGANDYITKPFDLNELRARVNVGLQMVEIQAKLAARVGELEAALAHVRQLQGILPICSYCQKVRNDKNYWEKVESYVVEHSDLRFSHGICPGCYDEVALPELEEIKQKMKDLE